MTSESFTTLAAIAAFIIIPAVIIWPEINKPTKPHKPTKHVQTAVKPVKQIAKAAPVKPTKHSPAPETIAAMHKQADAERAIAEAIEHKIQRVHDPIKRARLEKQAANSWLRFNQILDIIDKLTM